MSSQKSLQSLAEDSYGSSFSSLYAQLKDEKEAQKGAITKAFTDLISSTEYMPRQVWSAIYSAHVKRRSGRSLDLSEEEITQVISAHQSWIKSSGHAAEEFFKAESNKSLANSGLKVFLQREVTGLFHQNLIANSRDQCSILRDWLRSSSFDLFICSERSGGQLVFGCLQSKTSIRDRVTREREPSNQAMDQGFWSVALVIDGDFFRLDKFEKMVNGGTEIFPRCGWHQVYVLSLETEVKRIIRLERNFSNFRADAIAAMRHFEDEKGALFPTTFPFAA